MVAIFKNIWEIAATKSCGTASLLFVIVKFFEKHVSNKLVHHLETLGLFLISSMVSSLLIEAYIF